MCCPNPYEHDAIINADTMVAKICDVMNELAAARYALIADILIW